MRAWLAAHWAVVGLWVLFLSAVDFALMGVDKWKAKRDAWRIPELTLWAFALLGARRAGIWACAASTTRRGIGISNLDFLFWRSWTWPDWFGWRWGRAADFSGFL